MTKSFGFASWFRRKKLSRFVLKINRVGLQGHHQSVVQLWRQAGAPEILSFRGLLPVNLCVSAQYVVSRALFSLKQYVDARRLALSILDVKQRHHGAAGICFQSYFREKKFFEALTFLEDRVDGVFLPVEFLVERMSVIWRLNDVERHNELLPDAIQCSEGSARGATLLAVHLEGIGYTSEARKIVRGILTNFPDDIQSLVFLIERFSRLDTFDIPFVAANALRALSPNTLKKLAFYDVSETMMKLTRLTEQVVLESFTGGQGLFRSELVSKLVVELADGPVSTREFLKPNIAYAIGSLKRGGAERQLVNTIRAACDDSDALGNLYLFCNEDYDPDPTKTYYADIPHGSIILGLAVPILSAQESGSGDGALDSTYESLVRLLPPQMSNQVKHLAKNFNAKNISVVHAWLDSMNIRCCLAALISGVPRIILSARSEAPKTSTPSPRTLRAKTWRRCYRYLLKHPSVTLTHNSNFGRDSYKQWLGITGLEMPVVYNGVNPATLVTKNDRKVDLEINALKRLLHGSKVIGTVFRFVDVKRPYFWIQVASRVLQSAPEWKFVMVGDGPLLSSSIALTQSLGIRENFVFTGAQSSVASYLKLLDLFLMTSAHEGLPNSLIEAQSMGIPAVATAVGGVAEILVNDETGKLVPDSATAEAVADTVVQCLSDEQWIRDASISAKRRAMAKFDMVASYQSWKELYC